MSSFLGWPIALLGGGAVVPPEMPTEVREDLRRMLVEGRRRALEQQRAPVRRRARQLRAAWYGRRSLFHNRPLWRPQ